MNKIKVTIFISICISLFLTGCADPLPEMTSEQEDSIVHYAATVLLRHNAMYDDGLMSVEEMEKLMKRQVMPTPAPTKAPEKEEKPSGDSGEGTSSGTPIITDQRTLSDFVGIPGVSITYAGCEVTDAYPKQSTDEFLFSMDATPGNQLLVLYFDVYNGGADACDVDLLSMDLKYRLSIAGGSVIKALATLLTDDLKTMRVTLPSGETMREVVVFEIPEDVASTMGGAQLELTVKSATDSLKCVL